MPVHPLPHQHGNRTQHGPPHVLSHFAVRSCLSPPPFAPGAPLVTAHDCLRLRRAYGQSARGCSPVCRDAGERLLDGGPRLCWGHLEITWGRPWLHGMLLITCGHLLCSSAPTRQQSPAPGAAHYVMSPGQYASPMMVHGGAAAASPVVDCWGLPAWFPFGSAPQVQPAVVRAAGPPPALVAYDHIIKVLCMTNRYLCACGVVLASVCILQQCAYCNTECVCRRALSSQPPLVFRGEGKTAGE